MMPKCNPYNGKAVSYGTGTELIFLCAKEQANLKDTHF